MSQARPNRPPLNLVDPLTQLWQDRLLRAVDGGLAAIIFVAPLFMGGRGPVGRLVFIALAAFTAACWCCRQCLEARGRWQWTRAEWLILAGLGVLMLQLVSLPQAILFRLSPTMGQLLPMWRAENALRFGEWQQLSLAPHATLGGLVTFVAYALLFLVVTQRVRTLSEVKRLLRWVAVAAMGMAFFGITQMLLSNGKFFWIYEHPSRTTAGAVKGAFQNQNHFAHFVVLGLGPLVWWIYRLTSSTHSSRGSRSAKRSAWSSPNWHDPQLQRNILWIGLGIVTLAVLLTYSRGGALAFGVALVAILGVASWQRWFGKQALGGMALLLLVMFLAISAYGYQPLLAKLRTFSEAESLEQLSSGRRALWAAHADAIPRFWLAGTGVGTHSLVYKTYLEEYFDVEFTHGENGPLQLLLETGVLGTTVFLTGVVFVFLWTIRALRQKQDAMIASCAGALLPGLVASLIHSLGDFVWYIPACMSVTVILCACANCLDRLVQEPAADAPVADRPKAVYPVATLPRTSWIAITAVVTLAGIGMCHNRLPAAYASPRWDAYDRLARLSPEDRMQVATLEAMSGLMQRVVNCNPCDAKAQATLASINLRRFDAVQVTAENPMPLSQIRDAALASQFPSREAQDEWLARAVGSNRALLDDTMHSARRAVALCPLQGDAYVALANLAFLEGPREEKKHAYVEQALLVRPHSGSVLFSAGQEAALAGDPTSALKHWKRAFHQDPDARQELIRLLAGQMPLEDLLKEFEPDAQGLGELFTFYRSQQREEEARFLAERFAPAMEQEAKAAPTRMAAARAWAHARSLYAYLQATDQAVACAQQAVQASPSDFHRHQELADVLLTAQQFDAAIEQLEWCLRRHPDDADLQQKLANVKRRKLEPANTATAPSDAARR